MPASVERIPVPTATRVPCGHTNAYLVDRGEGLVVDPAAHTDRLRARIDAVDPTHVAVTHTHPDHVGAVTALVEGTDRIAWARAGHEARFRRATGVTPDKTFREGTAVGPTTVVETPGHAPDHVAFALPEPSPESDNEILLVGDLAVAEGSVLVGGEDGDLRAYLTSLRRLLVRDPTICHPGHGRPLADPAASARRLLAHRRDRERRVLTAVRSGARTPDAIVADAYDRDLGGARDLARSAVRAHLEKLAVEGQITWNGDRVKPV